MSLSFVHSNVFSLFGKGLVGTSPDKLSIIWLIPPNAPDTSLSLHDPSSIFGKEKQKLD